MDKNEDNNIKIIIIYTTVHNLDLHKSIITKNESKDIISIEKDNYDMAKNLIRSSLNGI